MSSFIVSSKRKVKKKKSRNNQSSFPFTGTSEKS